METNFLQFIRSEEAKNNKRERCPDTSVRNVNERGERMLLLLQHQQYREVMLNPAHHRLIVYSSSYVVI